jgi:hypothetical protein
MEEAEEERGIAWALRFRIDVALRSAGSKTGLCSAEEPVLTESSSEEHESRYSSSDSSASSSCVLNLPPWMGGRKLSHGPLMRPIW